MGRSKCSTVGDWVNAGRHTVVDGVRAILALDERSGNPPDKRRFFALAVQLSGGSVLRYCAGRPYGAASNGWVFASGVGRTGLAKE